MKMAELWRKLVTSAMLLIRTTAFSRYIRRLRVVRNSTPARVLRAFVMHSTARWCGPLQRASADCVKESITYDAQYELRTARSRESSWCQSAL